MEISVQNIIKQIQFKTDDTLEDIASKIGYSRQYLSKVRDGANSKKILNLLKEKYFTELQNAIFKESISIVQEPGAEYITEKKQPENQNKTIENLSEVVRMQAEIIQKLIQNK